MRLRNIKSLFGFGKQRQAATAINRQNPRRAAMEPLEGRALLSTGSPSGAWLDLEVPQNGSHYLSMEGVVGHKVVFEADEGGIATVYDAQTHTFSRTVFAQPQDSASAAIIGNKLLLAGGDSGLKLGIIRNPTNVVNIYDADTGQWSTAKLSVARANMQTAVVDHHAIFAGGYVNLANLPFSPASDIVDIYDDSTGQWTATALPRGHNSFRTFVAGERVFFIGGSDAGPFGSAPAAKAIDVYDVSSGQWTTRAASPSPLGGPLTENLGHLHFFVGGAYTDRHGVIAASDLVQIYNDDTDQWSTARLSKGRFGMATATVGNKVIFAGGSLASLNSVVSNVDIYDGTTGRWSTAKLSQARGGAEVNIVGNTVMFSGGLLGESDNALIRSNVVDIYDAKTDRWSTGTLSAAKHGIASATVGTKVVFLGTRATAVDAADKNLDVYDTRTGEWSRSSVAVGRDASADLGDDGLAPFVVDDQVIVRTWYSNPWHVLVPTDIAAPVVHNPAPGSVLAKPSTSFKWTAVPGATSYDVQLDGVMVRHLYRNRWNASWLVAEGAHKLRVFAHVDGGVVTGPLARFTVEGTKAKGRLNGVRWSWKPV